jgi:Tfp pilus assembly PilM family ATPase
MSPTSRKSAWLTATPPTVAIEIASGRVTVVELAQSSGGPVISACGSEPLPREAVAPALTGPNIPNPAVVIDALRRALDHAGLRAPRRAALVVPDSVARVSLLSFDEVPPRPSDLDQLIKWQLRKATPFPIDEARIDHLVAYKEGKSTTFAAIVARPEVLAEYEAVATAIGVHAGIVDLASFNVINAVIGAGAAAVTDWLVICLAEEATTIAILRGTDLMFYRHRAALDVEPLSALVHQTAMYHEDRLGGSAFSHVWLCGAALAAGGAERARRDISARLNVSAETVDIRPAASLRDRIAVSPDVLDALAAPVGILLRERKAA